MSQIKERPILFSAPMVRAILADQKTVTRRPIKVQPHIDASGNFCVGSSNYGQDGYGKPVTKHFVSGCCPYGKSGDRLWVRESFWGCDLPGYGDQPCVVYDDEWLGKEYKPAEARPWGRKFGRIPSIHMPREASRILLEITDVRVERLQDISEEQARAEGITDGGCVNCGNNEPCGCDFPAPCAVDSFVHLWSSINGPHAWDANPWVWVVEFKRVTP